MDEWDRLSERIDAQREDAMRREHDRGEHQQPDPDCWICQDQEEEQ